jgi:hypothetical protein
MGVLRMLPLEAEQQKAAIPGWLREDQKEGRTKRDNLHQ